MAVGDTVNAVVDPDRRNNIIRNHSACHILQEALRRVLGSHVHQSGSYVDENRCRFDFSHFSAVTPDEIEQIEKVANQIILGANNVNISSMPIAEAKEAGVIALFGEKYGDIVRVVDMNGQSLELCGGIHVSNTSNIGMFKIISEASVAAGIRRIEAVTGFGVLNLMNENINTINSVAKALKVNNANEVVDKSKAVANELKDYEKKIDELTAKLASMRVNGLFDSAKEICGCKFIVAAFNGTSPNVLRAMGDKVKAEAPNAVAVLTAVMDGKASIMAVCGKEAVAAGVHAGNIVKQVCAYAGGSGGGRADSAMGGATEIFKIDEATAKVPEMIEKMVNK